MIFIYQNIVDGIQFQMKHIMTVMKLILKNNFKISKVSGSRVEWVEEESFFF